MAFDLLYKRYYDKIYKYIRSNVYDSDTAHDLTQSVMFKTYSKINSFDSNRKFSSWLYRIAHNEYCNWYKNKRNQNISIDDENTSLEIRQLSNNEDMLAALISKEVKNENHINMVFAFHDLSPRYREILFDRYYLELTYKQLSIKWQIGENTVGTLINRAKAKLKEVIINQKNICQETN